MMEFEVTQDKDSDDWRVEAPVDHAGDGEVYVALFAGPLARERAHEYAALKGKGPAVSASSVSDEDLLADLIAFIDRLDLHGDGTPRGIATALLANATLRSRLAATGPPQGG